MKDYLKKMKRLRLNLKSLKIKMDSEMNTLNYTVMQVHSATGNTLTIILEMILKIR